MELLFTINKIKRKYINSILTMSLIKTLTNLLSSKRPVYLLSKMFFREIMDLYSSMDRQALERLIPWEHSSLSKVKIKA